MTTSPALAMTMAGVDPIGLHQANALLTAWDHSLGPCERPFGQEAYALHVDGHPVSLAISASIVNGPVAGYERGEVVELARLCTRPGDEWATRVMLRIWREVCAPRWRYWPVLAAVSYSQNQRHEGRIYRFDGWTKVTDQAGSTGGGAWSRKRYAGDAHHGKKTLWLWEYEREVAS